LKSTSTVFVTVQDLQAMMQDARKPSDLTGPGIKPRLTAPEACVFQSTPPYW